jgi:hypothetical protein
MLLIMLKARQIQAGAEWDSVIGFTVAAILVAGVGFLLLLVISKVIRRNRFLSGARSRRRHK